MSEHVDQQWLHGFLDLCLLNLLGTQRDYGLGLVDRLSAAGFGEVPGGTLYPSLLRLEKQGLVRATKEASASGPPRKYYELTTEGRRAMIERTQAWSAFRTAMDTVTAFEGVPVEGRRS